MLVVIGIIAVLAALTVPAVMYARKAALNGAIAIEINTNLSQALEQYKAKFGEYPPDGTDQNAINRHVQKAFPWYTGAIPQAQNGSTTGLTPFNSLTFWLGGMWDDTNEKFIGFMPTSRTRLTWGQRQAREARAALDPSLQFDPMRTDYGAAGTMTIGTVGVGAGTLTTKVLRDWPPNCLPSGGAATASTPGSVAYFRGKMELPGHSNNKCRKVLAGPRRPR